MTTQTNEAKAPTKREKLLASIVTLTDKGMTNPKKKGSMSYDRYQGYFAALQEATDKASGGDPDFDGDVTFTVADAYRHGVRGDDIRHDQEHGFIVLG